MFSCCERKSQRRNGSAPQTEREVSLHSSASGAHQTDREVSLYSSASGAHQTEREVSLHSRGGKKKLFFDFSRFSLERLCLDSEKFIIDFLIKKKYIFTHPFCVEMQDASIIALFIESHNCDKEKLFL